MQLSVLVRGLQNGSKCYVYWIGWRQGLGLWADWPEVRKAHTLIYTSTHDFHFSFLHCFIILLAYDLLSILFWPSQCVSKHLPMDNLQEDALQPTIITYGTAISACGGSAEWPFALTLLEDLRGKQIESNAVVQRGSRFMYIFTRFALKVQLHVLDFDTGSAGSVGTGIPRYCMATQVPWRLKSWLKTRNVFGR